MIVDHARFWSILDEARASARRGPVSASLERALAMCRDGTIADAKTLAILLLHATLGR